MSGVAVTRGLRSRSAASLKVVDGRSTHLGDVQRRPHQSTVRMVSPASEEERERRIAAALVAAGLPPASPPSEAGQQRPLGSSSSASSFDAGETHSRKLTRKIPSLGAIRPASTRPRSTGGTRTRSASKSVFRPGSALSRQAAKTFPARELSVQKVSRDSGVTISAVDDESLAQPEEIQPMSPKIVSNSSRAGILARMYRLPYHEVLRIAQELDALQDVETGHMSDENFQQWMRRVFDCNVLDELLLEDAREVAMPDRRVNLNKFLAWYVQNMFFEINKLNSCPDRLASDALVSEMAERYKMPAVTMDIVKREFDRFDYNKDALLDYAEFLDMVHTLLRANIGDLSEQRIQRFWNELDKDGNGTVDFAEFIDWFMKYFIVVGEHIRCCLMENFYESFKPSVQRRNFVIRSQAERAGGAV